MKTWLLILSLLSGSVIEAAQASSSSAENKAIVPICGATVAALFHKEVDVPNKPDKFKHCSISCVMALYCGPVDSIEVGALKEVYDAMGFGDPDIKDLEADADGIKIAMKLGLALHGSRPACYQACSKLFP